MPISSVTNRVEYQGDGTSAVFAWPYGVQAQSHLSVFIFNSSASIPGMITPQVLNTHYTFSGVANNQGIYPSGGTIVFNSSPNAQSQIIIFRSSAITNAFTIAQNGAISSTGLVNELDYITMLEQRAQDLNTRSVRFPDGLVAGTFDPTLPPNIRSAGVAGWGLLVNSSQTGFVLSPIGSSLFSGILPIQYGGTGTGSAGNLGAIVYVGSGGVFAYDPMFFWDPVNNFMGINTQTPQSPITITANSSFVSPATDTFIHLVGNNNRLARISMDTHGSSATGGGAGLFFRRTQGTASAPSAVVPDDVLGFIGAMGYGFDAFALGTKGSMSIKSSQLWTNSNQGTYIHFNVTANSTISSVEQMRLDNDGSLYLRKYGTTLGALQVGSGGLVSAGLLSVGNGGTGTGTSYVQYGVIIASSATQLASVPVGGPGTALISNGSSAPSFQNLAAALNTVTTVTATYSALTTDNTILATSSGYTVFLYGTAGNVGQTLEVQKITNDFGIITIAASSATINAVGIGTGTSQVTLNTFNENIVLQCVAGSSWIVKQRTIPSNWTAYTPASTAGFGSATIVVSQWKRDGDSIFVNAKFTCGTVSGATAKWSLPTGLTAASWLSTSSHCVGVISHQLNSVNTLVMLVSNGADGLNYGVSSVSTSGLTPAGGNAIFASAESVGFTAIVPIQGWQG